MVSTVRDDKRGGCSPEVDSEREARRLCLAPTGLIFLADCCRVLPDAFLVLVGVTRTDSIRSEVVARDFKGEFDGDFCTDFDGLVTGALVEAASIFPDSMVGGGTSSSVVSWSTLRWRLQDEKDLPMMSPLSLVLGGLGRFVAI